MWAKSTKSKPTSQSLGAGARAAGRRRPDEPGVPLTRDQRRSRSPAKVALPDGPRHRQRWEPSEIAFLRREWGEITLALLARRLRRTAMAVLQAARVLGLPNPNQGRMPLRAFARASGFCPETILRAAKRAKIALPYALRGSSSQALRGAKLLRPPRRRAIDPEVAERLLAVLLARGGAARLPMQGTLRTSERGWGVASRPPACLACGQTERPHYGAGLCRICSQRRRRGWGVGGVPPACRQCGLTQVQHRAGGVCSRCERYGRLAAAARTLAPAAPQEPGR